MPEVWKRLPKASGFARYEVSDRGRVWDTRSDSAMRIYRIVKGRVAKEDNSSKGRNRVQVYDAKQETFRMVSVSTLMLMAFDRMPKSWEEARHLDDTPRDALDNLAWGTRQQNSDDRRCNKPESYQHHKGVKESDETREKKRIAAIAQHARMSAEEKTRRSQQQSKLASRMMKDPKRRQRLSDANRGKVQSAETLEKRRETMIARGIWKPKN